MALLCYGLLPLLLVLSALRLQRGCWKVIGALGTMCRPGLGKREEVILLKTTKYSEILTTTTATTQMLV